MRLIAFFFLLIAGIGNVAEAQKCKYDLDKTDPMSDERIRRIENKIKSFLKVSYYRKGDDFRVELYARFAGERNFIVPKGSILKLKLSDGTILELANSKDASPVSYVSSNQVMTNYAMSYHISKEQMKQIADHGFKVVNTKLGDNEITYPVEKEKHIERNASNAACMLID